MILQLIMLFGATFALLYAFKVKNTYARFLNWSMVIAVGVTFFPVIILKGDGYYLLALAQLGAIVYSLAYTDFSKLKKWTLFSSGLLSLIPMTLLLTSNSDAAPSFMLWYIYLAPLTGLLQLGIFGYAVKHDVQAFKEELGFLIILSCDALTRILGFLLFLAN